MASTIGNKPLEKKEPIAEFTTLRCACCHREYDGDDYYSSDSDWHAATCKIPCCKKCLDKFYLKYLEKYEELEYSNPDKRAIQRMCMVLDLYYSDKLFDSAVRDMEKRVEKMTDPGITITLFSSYMKGVKRYQNRGKDYDTTIQEKFLFIDGNEDTGEDISDLTPDEQKHVRKAVRMFGKGLKSEDYLFLWDEYDDWTTRYECKTKAQEELFQRLAFTKWSLHKASLTKQNTKDLEQTYQKLMETANLQPRQTSGDAMANHQSFGTLIQKWEEEDPIPETEEELRDVDNIGLYIDVFFKGHTAKMLGIKNAFSNLYDSFMEKYTVQKPEYQEESGNQALFDLIFGSKLKDEGGK